MHGIGARVGDVLAEAALAIFFKASAEDLGRATHAHPSLSEILKEAAFGRLGEAHPSLRRSEA